MSIDENKYYFGWLPDYPDFRDYTVEKDKLSAKSLQAGVKESVAAMAAKTGILLKTGIKEEAKIPKKKLT